MAYTGTQQFQVAAEVAPSTPGEDRVRVLIGTTRIILNADEAQAMGMQLLREAKLARGANPAIQHANTDIHDPAVQA